MKRQAFFLLAGVIAAQMVIVAGVLTGCFITKDARCSGKHASDLLTLVVSQAFALYAAESNTKN